MGLIKEPKDIDFSVESTPWTEEELADFRKLMAEIKKKRRKVNPLPLKKRKKKVGA